MIEWMKYNKNDDNGNYLLGQYSERLRLLVTDGLQVAECRLELHYSKGRVWRNGRGIFDNVTHYAKLNLPNET